MTILNVNELNGFVSVCDEDYGDFQSKFDDDSDWKLDGYIFTSSNIQRMKEVKKSTRKTTKKEAARLLFDGSDRKGSIEKFMDELDMSKCGASTYFYNFQKGIW